MKRIAGGPILFLLFSFFFCSVFPLIFFLRPRLVRRTFFSFLSLSHPFLLLNISSPFLLPVFLLFLFHIYFSRSISLLLILCPSFLHPLAFFSSYITRLFPNPLSLSLFSLILSKYTLPSLSVRISRKPLLNYLLSVLIAFFHVPPPLPSSLPTLNPIGRAPSLLLISICFSPVPPSILSLRSTPNGYLSTSPHPLSPYLVHSVPFDPLPSPHSPQVAKENRDYLDEGNPVTYVAPVR